jgi:integrase
LLTVVVSDIVTTVVVIWEAQLSIHKRVGKHKTSYQVKWRNELGRQTSKVFNTKREASAFEAMVITNKDRGTSLDHRGGKAEFSAYVDEWKRTKATQRPSTRRRRDGILDKHILPHLGSRAISSIKPHDIQRLVNTWTSDGLSPRTVTHHIRVISPIFDMAVKNDLITRNPCSYLNLPKIRKAPVRALTPEECRRLIEAMPDHYRPMIRFTLATGVRWGEVVALTINCLDIKNRQIHVKQSKTDAGIRSIPLHEDDLQVIIGHLRDTARTCSQPGDPLFVTERGSALNNSNFRQRVFKNAAIEANLAGITFHDLRRTHATMLVAAGVDIKTVQYRMGHESITTTLAIYATPTEGNLRKSVDAIDLYLNQT